MIISKFRVGGFLVCIAFVCLAFYIPNKINGLDLIKPLDIFSYWGTTATIIGLVITVSEVLHSVQVTTETQDRIIEEVSNIMNIRDASIISESISILNSMVLEIDDGNYQMARKSFEFYRVTSRPLNIDYSGPTPLDKLKYIDSNLQDLTSNKIDNDNTRQIEAVKNSVRDLIRKLEDMDPVKALAKS